MRLFILMTLVLQVCVTQDGTAQDRPQHYTALGAQAQRVTDVSWNRFHDHAGLHRILQELHEAFPQLTELYSIGKSYEGRDLWCLEVTNKELGDSARKPGMYIDGNIHGNEVQGGEVVAYIAWYLCENYGHLERVTELLDEKVFYLIPTINPDGRDYWFEAAHTRNSSRSGKTPVDDDRDGLVDEDDYDDLDGDGSITSMRIKDPNGRWKPDPKYPEYLMVRADPDERGTYTVLGGEGIDNDGDGRINEDRAGGYDSNRNWAYNWAPDYIQRGSHEYPFSLPNTRAVADFVIDHPNIAGAQSFHNYGGLILRGPSSEDGAMHPRDAQVMETIGEKGEKQLPHYQSVISWSHLYTTLGDEIAWFYGARGIIGLSNELWTAWNLNRADTAPNESRRQSEVAFVRDLMMGDGLVAWHEVEHPTYGVIEIGGLKKEFGRVPPSFLLEEECHRNAMFVIYHARTMPLLRFGEISIEKLADRLYRVWVEVRNEGLIPSRTAWDIDHHISPPDYVTVSGDDADVLSSGVVIDQYFKRVAPTKIRPYRVEFDTVPGMGAVRAQFLIEGSGTIIITVDSTKGGLLTRDYELE